MNRSGSRFALNDPSEYLGSGLDLSLLQQQLARERNARTLTVRPVTRPSIAAILNKKTGGRGGIGMPPATPEITIEKVIETLNSDNQADIKQTLGLITNGKHPKIASSQELPIALMNLIERNLSEDVSCSALAAIGVLSPQMPEILIDGNGGVTLIDILNDTLVSENQTIKETAIRVCGAVAEASVYARDAILCTGVFDQLCDIAGNSETEMEENACEAISKVFTKPEEIEKEILVNVVSLLQPLLQLKSITSLSFVLTAFTSISCEMAAQIFEYHQIGLYTKAVHWLKEPELTPVCLKLIGNVSNGKLSHIEEMMEEGMFGELMSLIETEYTADVLWIFSNLAESATVLMKDLFTEEFINRVIEFAQNSGFDVKREASFFIASYILYIDPAISTKCIRPETIEILVEMMGNGVPLLIVRAIDSIVKVLRSEPDGVVAPDAIAAITGSKELNEKLDTLLGSDVPMVTDAAAYLIDLLDGRGSA